jgi:hypothetical protein
MVGLFSKRGLRNLTFLVNETETTLCLASLCCLNASSLLTNIIFLIVQEQQDQFEGVHIPSLAHQGKESFGSGREM